MENDLFTCYLKLDHDKDSCFGTVISDLMAVLERSVYGNRSKSHNLSGYE